MTIKFYCELCKKPQPVEIEKLKTDDLNPGVAWGDIVCTKCYLVLITISTEPANQGEYEFVKVKENDRSST